MFYSYPILSILSTFPPPFPPPSPIRASLANIREASECRSILEQLGKTFLTTWTDDKLRLTVMSVVGMSQEWILRFMDEDPSERMDE